MGTKEKILNSLKKGDGEWVSGGDICGGIGVSRNAVWKAIESLRGEGYEIEAVSRKGYRLLRSPDSVTAAEVCSGMKSVLFGAGDLRYYRVTDSTNLRAREAADAGCPEGTLFTADMQTGGRGRRGRSWFSGEGLGIYLSIVLRPRLVPERAPAVTLMTAVALTETLRAVTGIPVRIKWPNDLMAGTKKLAGILTEMSTQPDAVEYIVAGAGINVRHRPEDIPVALRSIATSLFIESGMYFNRADIIRRFLERFEHYYTILLSEGFRAILPLWKDYADIIGRRVTITSIHETLAGVVQDVRETGALVLLDGSGVLHEVLSGDVSLRE